MLLTNRIDTMSSNFYVENFGCHIFYTCSRIATTLEQVYIPAESISGDNMSELLATDQRRAFDFIVSCLVSPTYREIAAHLGDGYGVNTVARILNRLEKKGLISKCPRTPRSIRVLAMPESKAAG
jgi:hypothetical protein